VNNTTNHPNQYTKGELPSNLDSFNNKFSPYTQTQYEEKKYAGFEDDSELHRKAWNTEDARLLSKLSASLKMDWKKIEAKFISMGRHPYPAVFLR